MDPMSFIALAKNLTDHAKNNPTVPTATAEFRSAISRAYYATFHVAVEYFDELDIITPDSGLCHTAVIRGLNNSGDTELAKISGRLGTLYDNRRIADYKLRNTSIESPAQAETVTKLAEETITLLRTQRQKARQDSTKRGSIQSTILSWAKTNSQPLKKK